MSGDDSQISGLAVPQYLVNEETNVAKALQAMVDKLSTRGRLVQGRQSFEEPPLIIIQVFSSLVLFF